MNPALLVLNAGSSSLKLAVFEQDPELHAVFQGSVERIGKPDAALVVRRGPGGKTRRSVNAATHEEALGFAWQELHHDNLEAVAHRIVHGGHRYVEPQVITPAVLAELRRLEPFDPEHLPPELGLIDAVSRRMPELRQVACFDTAFHQSLPPVARLLPLPRRFADKGVRRYGFHGLSYQFLLGELGRLGDTTAARGRIVLAHLGNGASLAAVRDGQCIDTTMSFTPAAGIMMGTRSGDIDPGLIAYLATTEHLTIPQFNCLVNHESGLLGVSDSSGDMQELLARESRDPRAAEAVELFCYQAKKALGGYAAALGGLDTLVFAGGIGEHCPSVRSRICAGLGYLGLEWDERSNAAGNPVVSAPASRVTVRVIHTDEEQMIARTTATLLARVAPN